MGKCFFSDSILNPPKERAAFNIYSIANELEITGKKVIHMEIGKPDFDTPKIIKDAAIGALNEGFVHYTELSGIYDLKKSIVDREEKLYGLKYEPNEVIITTGASEGLYSIWTAFLNPTDEIMIPTPHYSGYSQQLSFIGANIISVPTMKNNMIKFDISEFHSRLTKNTKMILINNPCNPTGYVMSNDDLENIAKFAIDNDLLVVSDECYDNFVYEGKFKSIAELPGMKERTLIVNSTSKTFSMTGWRVGYVLGNIDYINAINKVHQQITMCATSFAQAGATIAYRDVYIEVDEMVEEFRKRREYIIGFLDKIDEISYVSPQGAFYVFANISKLGISDVDFCEGLLKSKGVAFTYGSSFGIEFTDYIRISYAVSMDNIIKAMNLMKEYIEEIVK
mgnify:CR=1 FL=1